MEKPSEAASRLRANAIDKPLLSRLRADTKEGVANGSNTSPAGRSAKSLLDQE